MKNNLKPFFGKIAVVVGGGGGGGVGGEGGGIFKT